jgi:predicted phage tail protein
VLDSVSRYELEVTNSADGLISHLEATTTLVHLEPVKPWTTYTARVRAISGLGRTSDFSTPVSVTTGGDSTPPNALPGVSGGLVMTPVAAAIIATWTSSTDIDVANGEGAYDVQIDTADTFSSVDLLGLRVDGAIATFADLHPNTTYYGRVRAVDSSGNFGPWTDPLVSATTGQ